MAFCVGGGWADRGVLRWWWAVDDHLNAKALETVYRTWNTRGSLREIIFKIRLCLVDYAPMTGIGRDVMLAC